MWPFQKCEYKVVNTQTISWVDRKDVVVDRATLLFKENGAGHRKVTYTKSNNSVERHSYWHEDALPWIHSKTCITVDLKQKIEALESRIRSMETKPVASDSDETKRLRKHNKKLLERIAYYEKKED